MIPLDIFLEKDGDGCWPDLLEKDAQGQVIWNDGIGGPLLIAGLAGGMASGKPSVTLRINLPDGRVIVAQTTLALLLTAADGLKARYGDPRQ